MLFKTLNNKYTGLLFMLVAIGYLSFEMFGQDKQSFLPGKTTSAHYQVEVACDICHTPFEGVKQEACLDCHGEALKDASDSHAKKVFSDPRSFAMLEKIDAKRCVTCHTEHLDDQHSGKIASIPSDFCFACHDDIAEERPSHKELPKDGCSASGCHNYHDNTALYEDFVKRHIDEENTYFQAQVPLPNVAEKNQKKPPYANARNLIEEDQDAPIQVVQNQLIIKQWVESGHSHSGVNCSHCHQPESKTSDQIEEWNDYPKMTVCVECHKNEADSFYKGKHGMRLEAGLPPMEPKLARIAMKKEANDKQLTCNSCHAAHDYNIKKAAVDSCLSCHNDKHSNAYIDSPHQLLWQKELSGELPEGAGVSCATCHLPRLTVREKGKKRVLVNHNQNANLRPNSKMIRDVCMQCHGLEFSLQSLADEGLMLNNYSASSDKKHKTIEMVRNRKKK